MAKWYRFDPEKGSRQKRPPDLKWVLVMVASVYRDDGSAAYPDGVAVGYLKYAAGDRQSPMFVVPQFGYGKSGRVIGWCDCLPDDIKDISHEFALKERTND